MNTIRIAITIFILVLVVLSVAGWVWTGSHQPAAQSLASRVVLSIGALAGIVGLVKIWRSH
jgi:hypothetical protein